MRSGGWGVGDGGCGVGGGGCGVGVNVSVSSRGLHLLLFPLVVFQSCLNGILSQHWEEEHRYI